MKLTISLTIMVVCSGFLTSLRGQSTQQAEPIRHLEFVDAGIKYDRLWITLLNFRTKTKVNSKADYFLYSVDRSEPIFRLNLQSPDFQKFPVLEVTIPLKELLGVQPSIKTDLVFILFVVDGNTQEDNVFLGKVLPFHYRPDLKSIPLGRNIPRPLEEIPLYYTLPFPADTMTVFPVVSPADTGGRIDEFVRAKFSVQTRVLLHSIDISTVRGDVKKRLGLIGSITDALEARLSGSAFNELIRGKLNEIKSGR